MEGQAETEQECLTHEKTLPPFVRWRNANRAPAHYDRWQPREPLSGFTPSPFVEPFELLLQGGSGSRISAI